MGQRRAVVIIGRWLLPSLVDTGDICCHYWQHILVSSLASQITSFEIVYSTVYSSADQRKHQSSASGLCVGNSPEPVNSPHKGPVTRKMFPLMTSSYISKKLPKGFLGTKVITSCHPGLGVHGKRFPKMGVVTFWEIGLVVVSLSHMTQHWTLH